MKKFIVLLLLVGFYANDVNAQEEAKTRKQKRQEKKEAEFREIEKLIDSKLYMFDAQKANSSGGKQIDLTTHTAELIISNDSVDSYLPFFGRAYNASYGGGADSGIKFETTLEDYKVDKNSDKLIISITFSAKGSNDNYNCSLSVTSSGAATLSVTSNNRAQISYYGMVVPIKK